MPRPHESVLPSQQTFFSDDRSTLKDQLERESKRKNAVLFGLAESDENETVTEENGR